MKQELIGGLVLCLIGLGLFFIPPVALWTLTEKWKTEHVEKFQNYGSRCQFWSKLPKRFGEEYENEKVYRLLWAELRNL